MDKMDYDLCYHRLHVYPSKWISPKTIQDGKGFETRGPSVTVPFYPSQWSPGVPPGKGRWHEHDGGHTYRKGKKVSLKHLQFADDTLIFAPRNSMCITNYFRILDVFSMMSDLSMNYSKSCLISWNSSNHDWARDIARSVGCLHSKCPFTYLGFPLGDNMYRCSA